MQSGGWGFQVWVNHVLTSLVKECTGPKDVYWSRRGCLIPLASPAWLHTSEGNCGREGLSRNLYLSPAWLWWAHWVAKGCTWGRGFWDSSPVYIRKRGRSMHARHRVQRLPAWLHQKLEMSQKCGSEAEGLGAAYTSVRGARMVLEVLNSQIFHSTPKRSVPSLCFLFMGHTSRKWGYVPMFQQCTKHQSTLNCWAPIFSSFWTHNLLLDKGSLLGSSQQI